MKNILIKDKKYIYLTLYFTDKSDKAEAKEVLYGLVREDTPSALRASYLAEIDSCLNNKVHSVVITCDKKFTHAQTAYYFDTEKKPCVRAMLKSFDFDYFKSMMKNKKFVKGSER